MQCCSVGPAVLLTLLLVGDVVTSAAVWKHSCERPNITNGRVVTVRTPRKSATGHMFKYRCRRGYRRLGNMYNICLRGRWVLEHPFCARRGCAALASPAGGSARQSVQGDVTTFQCEPGYRLTGDASLHCNGRQWNGTAPACEGPGSLVWTPAADGGGGGGATLLGSTSGGGCHFRLCPLLAPAAPPPPSALFGRGSGVCAEGRQLGAVGSPAGRAAGHGWGHQRRLDGDGRTAAHRRRTNRDCNRSGPLGRPRRRCRAQGRRIDA